MENKHWQYKLGRNIRGFIILLVMSAVFTGISIWLRIISSGAFIFIMGFDVLILIITALAAYRIIFNKILIGEKGLYYQTKPGNGKYCKYTEIKKAWVSSGSSLDGAVSCYCSYQTTDNNTHKFSFLPHDLDGVDYFLSRVNTDGNFKPNEIYDNNISTYNSEPDKVHTYKNKEWDYKICDEQNRLTIVIFLLVISVIFVALTIEQLIKRTSANLMIAFSFGLMAVTSLQFLIRLLIRFSFLKIYIGKDEFYFQSNPFNGKYYKYTDIKSCNEKKRTSRTRGTVNDLKVSYFFTFTERNGKTKKFQFDKAVYEHEINELKERINRVNN